MLDGLIGPLVLDFVAPMPVDEAQRRLKAREHFGPLGARQVRVALDADGPRFVFKQWGGTETPTEVYGTLERAGMHTTHVTARVNLAWHLYVLFGLFALFIIWFVMTSITESPVLTLAITTFWILGYWLLRRERREIARQIQAIFSPAHW